MLRSYGFQFTIYLYIGSVKLISIFFGEFSSKWHTIGGLSQNEPFADQLKPEFLTLTIFFIQCLYSI